MDTRFSSAQLLQEAPAHPCATAHTRADRQVCLLQNERLHLCRTENPADLSHHSIFPFFKNKNNNNHQKIPPTRSSTEPALICKCSPCCKEKKNCLCIRAAEHFREACRQGEKTLLIGSNEQEAGTILLFLQGFESSSDSPESNLLNELLPMLQHRHLSGRVRKGHCCPTGNSSG